MAVSYKKLWKMLIDKDTPYAQVGHPQATAARLYIHVLSRLL